MIANPSPPVEYTIPDDAAAFVADCPSNLDYEHDFLPYVACELAPTA